MRPNQPANWDVFSLVSEAIAPTPLIANGDIYDQESLQRSRQIPGVASWMIARGAQWNVSVFMPEGRLPIDQVTIAYIRKAIEYGMPFNNAKYTVLQMWMGAQEQERLGAKQMVKDLQRTRSYEGLCQMFSIEYSPPQWKILY